MADNTASRIAVSNTTPIIGLVEAGALTVLERLFERVMIPGEVWNELIRKPDAPEPVQFAALSNGVVDLAEYPIPREAVHLHKGERAAIALAVKLRPMLILLDEKDARDVAEGLGLSVRGTLGLLVQAKRLGVISAVKPCIDRLVARNFYLSERLIKTVLKDVGEC